MKKRIGMVLDNEFTGDPRVENEVLVLQKSGHKVFVLCFNHGNKKEIEDFHGATIVRININLQVKKKLKGLNNTILNIYPHYWKRKIVSFALENNIEVLHIHDLWLLEAGLLANKKLKLPIIADLHENFVHAIKHYKYSTTFPGNILISHEKWAKCELKWLNKVQEIIVVIDEAKHRLINLGIPEKKITVVANYVNIEEYSKEDIQLTKRLHSRYSNNNTIVYTGGFDKHRGLDILLMAVPLISKVLPNFKLILVGGGGNEEELKTLAKNLEIEDMVDFPGYLPHTSLVSYVKIADACTIPHLKNEHTDNTIPHKLFQYMLMAKPVIASNCAPIERILQKTQAGLIYTHNSPEECAEVVLKILGNPNKEMGQRGKQAVLDHYNWNSTSKELENLYTDK